MLKCISHGRKVINLGQPHKPWFEVVMHLVGLHDLGKTRYGYTNHVLLSTFMEICHTNTSLFHLLVCEMSTALDDVSCLLLHSIMGKLLNYSTTNRSKSLDIKCDLYYSYLPYISY